MSDCSRITSSGRSSSLSHRHKRSEVTAAGVLFKRIIYTYPEPGCLFWPPTEMKHFFFSSLTWKTVSELFTTVWPWGQKTFEEHRRLEKGPSLARREPSALGLIGSWSSSCRPAALLCSRCWRCHHQRSNKAKAFSESLFTVMTSHWAVNTLVQDACTAELLDSSVWAGIYTMCVSAQNFSS